ALFWLPSPASGAETGPASPPVAHALLINGGGEPAANYQSHLHHIQDMRALLRARGIPEERIHIFSADGDEPAADMAVRGMEPGSFWLLEGTPEGRLLRSRTEITDTSWDGVKPAPARKAALRDWFGAAGGRIRPGEELLIFVTDHGTPGPDSSGGGAISLWKESLTVREFDEMLALLPTGVRVVLIMSQCYSGAFASSMYAGGEEPSGGVCGFFSTLSGLPSFGCYPEGRDRDRIGHAFEFIEGFGPGRSALDAHRQLLVADATPDVPLTTSDVYLDRLVKREAERLGRPADTVVDDLLARAYGDRAAWEREIRLLDRLGEAYGFPSARFLHELKDAEEKVPKLIDRMRSHAEAWSSAAATVKTILLRRFAAQSGEWKQRLGRQELERLDGAARRRLLAELLDRLEPYAKAQPDLWPRLEKLQTRARAAAQAEWRLEVRLGVLRRMRVILVGLAGRELAARGHSEAPGAQDRRRSALAKLDRCEESSPGGMSSTTGTAGAAGEKGEAGAAVAPLRVADPAEPFPSLSSDARLMEELTPAWLGVRFRSVPEGLPVARELSEGAAWLQGIFPGSPAEQAGLAAGDIILGAGGEPFEADGALREWTMMSPPGVPKRLSVLRMEGAAGEREFEATVTLGLSPEKWPELPEPPGVGDAAPPLPEGLERIGSVRPPRLQGREYVLFFWATWCAPCKRAVPELSAFARARNLPVLAVSDEDAATVSRFLETRREEFFQHVAVDPRRQSFLAWGVSGTPTIVLVGPDGRVRHRQVGYDPAAGLAIEGWTPKER
ncbi:MAG TPA: redoxin domain-containing protein, partial [Candidatus Polarisedimenticolia bacterium]|nr:redoxin domain-containing protein [Candidatus Polarisedimenticolia bacterium]